MSKALVLVAGLYVFLAPICDKQDRETSMKGSNEQGQGKRHHKQIELLDVAYVLLFSCLPLTIYRRKKDDDSRPFKHYNTKPSKTRYN